MRHINVNDLATQSQGTQPFPTPQRRSSVALTDDEGTAAQLKALVDANLELTRIRRRLFDASNPVHDYEVIAASAGDTVIRPEFDVSVLYKAIAYSLPLGTTSAVLTIGTNLSITLYSGGALTVQQLQVFPYLSITAVPDDKRKLTVAGATSIGYIGLMGHVLEREGSR